MRDVGRKLNLRYNFPMVLFILAFGAVVFMSFKHEPAPDAQDVSDATKAPQAVIADHLLLSAMHADPAAKTPPSIQADKTAVAQLKILDEILVAKNDNDPRLDRDLRELSSAAKQLLRKRYQTLAQERRNARGTIVFLMGRNLASAEDMDFLHQVLSEPPCLSLNNCENEDKASINDSDRHQEGPHETTLAYPQLVALRSIQNYLNSAGPTAALSPQALSEVEFARRSPVRKIASLAEEIAQAYRTPSRD